MRAAARRKITLVKRVNKMAAPILPHAHALAPEAVMHGVGQDRVLQASTVAGMVGVLHQLGRLAEQAHEIFDGLTAEATRSAQRVQALQERADMAGQRLLRVDEAVGAARPEDLANLCATSPGIEYHAPAEEQSGLFTDASRPPSLQAAFEAARRPPQLGLLDPFVTRPEGGGKYAKYNLIDTCADGYSDAHFFLKQWLDEEEAKFAALKAERRARKAERRRGKEGADGLGAVKRDKAKKVVKKKFLTEEELSLIHI